MGPLSHLTHTEYSALLSRSFHSSDETQLLTLKNVDPPEKWDWRTKGVVTPICNQGACAASWAFSTIAAEESQWAIQKDQLLVLSSQCLVDCVQLSFGCGGGWPSGTYKSIMKQFNGTFILDSDYPYTAKRGVCKFDSMPKAAPIMTTYGTTTKYNETALALAVSLVGVATVSVDASRTSFQLYQSGIYYEPDCSTETMDLSMACVGYGTEGTTNYWIVKNCFGDKWGEQGYIRMIKDKNNNCAIATDVHIPQVI